MKRKPVLGFNFRTGFFVLSDPHQLAFCSVQSVLCISSANDIQGKEEISRQGAKEEKGIGI